jgi:hydrogenase maturation factor
MCMTEPARILAVTPDHAEARAWTRTATLRLSLAVLTLDGHVVRPGDWVLASAGLAIEPMAEDDALDLLSFLNGADGS